MAGFDFPAVAAYLGTHPTLGAEVAVELGYVDMGDKMIGPCPWHVDRKPSSVVFAPSSSTTGRWLVYDQPCGKRRDVLDLIAKLMGLPDARGANYRAVLVEGCRRVGVDPASIKAGSVPVVAPRAALREVTPEQRREIVELYRSLDPLTADGRDDVRAWMAGAGLLPEALESQTRVGSGYRIAGILPTSRALPAWARIGDQTWAEAGLRIVATRWYPDGSPGWPKALSVEVDPWIKSVGPKGGSSRGVVGANMMYHRLLCIGPDAFMVTWAKARATGWATDEHPTLAICEGEKDGLALASIAPKDALVGWVDSGSWTPEHAARIPDGTRVLILTDSDGAGMRYQAEIVESLRDRCPVRVLNPIEDYRLDQAGERVKLPDVADLVRDGARWEDLSRRLVGWAPPVLASATQDELDVAAIGAAACAPLASFLAQNEPTDAPVVPDAPSLSTELPSISMPAQAPMGAPPIAPPAAPSGQSAREIMEASLRYLHKPAAPKPATAKPAAPKPEPKPESKSEPKPEPKPESRPAPIPAARVELDESDPRRSLCERLGEVPLVTIRDGHKEPLVYIASRCCPPPAGSGERKMSIYRAPSGDILAKCYRCGRPVNAMTLRPLTEPVTKAEPVLKAEPVTKAEPVPRTPPKPKAATKAEPKAEPEVVVHAATTSPLQDLITAALAGGPVLRDAVVAQIRAAGLRATKAELKEAREAAMVKSYTVADQQWWALAGTAPAPPPRPSVVAPTAEWVN